MTSLQQAAVASHPPVPMPYVAAISPYQPGKPITELAREMGIPVEKIVKLASNENPLGMSPHARQAIEAALVDVARYPDQFELIHALAERNGVQADQIVLGNGSNDILDLVARAFLAQGRSAICSAHAFAVYPLATLSIGATCLTAPAHCFAHDLEAMLALVRDDTHLIWIANPNNPTGTFLREQELLAFMHKVPKHVVVVLDEAYNDYLTAKDYYDTTPWVKQFPNLVITRTFSKIYGLAGLRMGYGLGSAVLVDLMNRVRQPFNCNNLALVGALAALNDRDFLDQSKALNQAGLAQLESGFKKLNLEFIPSFGNFITFRAGDAAQVNQQLLQHGVIVRPIAGYGMPEWLRVTVGTEAENARFLDVLQTLFKAV